MVDQREDAARRTQSSLGVSEAITLCGIWACGLGAVGLIVVNYKGDQSVSFENAIAYVMIAVLLVSVAILFRGAITDFIHSRSNQRDD